MPTGTAQKMTNFCFDVDYDTQLVNAEWAESDRIVAADIQQQHVEKVDRCVDSQ